MAVPIEIPTFAYMLGLVGEDILTPRDWMSPAAQRAETVSQLSSGLAMPSFWTAEEIRSSFDEANAIWAVADIRFSLNRVARRTERVSANEHEIYVGLTNRLGRVPGCRVVAAFVNTLASRHGGIAGGRLAIVTHGRLAHASPQLRGAVLAHEFGHVLDLADRVGPRDGNLMYYQMTIGGPPNRDLSESQIGVAQRRAERIMR